MTKRASGKFEPSPQNFYPTPFKAVAPLIPHLDELFFDEPCVGEGHLVRHLESYGLRCRYRGDISTGQDALGWMPEDLVQICTNPPWSWPLLKPLLEHFIATGKTVWLLLDADMLHNVRMRKFLKHCFRVVSVGRLKWIEDSAHQGFDNAAWYGFDEGFSGNTEFFARM